MGLVVGDGVGHLRRLPLRGIETNKQQIKTGVDRSHLRRLPLRGIETQRNQTCRVVGIKREDIRRGQIPESETGGVRLILP